MITTPHSAQCAICEGRIEYLDPTDDGLATWWAHENHPEDGHDARPARLIKDRGGLWRGVCESCGWIGHLLSKTKADTSRKQHRAATHNDPVPPVEGSPEWLNCCAACGSGDWNEWNNCPEHLPHNNHEDQ